MKLVITKSIQSAEFELHQDVFNLDVIKAAAKKAIQGLGVTLKSASKVSGTQLKKVNLTTSGGAGRVLFLLKLGKDKVVLVMLRSKNDKQLGANMSIENSKFRRALEKNIDMILEDLSSGNYEEIDIC